MLRLEQTGQKWPRRDFRYKALGAEGTVYKQNCSSNISLTRAHVYLRRDPQACKMHGIGCMVPPTCVPRGNWTNWIDDIRWAGTQGLRSWILVFRLSAHPPNFSSYHEEAHRIWFARTTCCNIKSMSATEYNTPKADADKGACPPERLNKH